MGRNRDHGAKEAIVSVPGTILIPLCLLGREACVQSIWWPLGLLVKVPTLPCEYCHWCEEHPDAGAQGSPFPFGMAVYSSFLPFSIIRLQETDSQHTVGGGVEGVSSGTENADSDSFREDLGSSMRP